ncbi:MAG: hypothetical protein JNK87_05405 [Bryobacterales bacterium]|nr:hypothetical protein [Bryobacterales bacterium]
MSTKVLPELSENRASALCYLLGPITGFLFLTLQPYSRNMLVRFHAWQSIFAGAALALFYIAVLILSPHLPWVLLSFVWFFVFGVLLSSVVLWVYLIAKTFTGERLVIPVIGERAEDRAYADGNL